MADRYARQELIAGWQQERLAAASVVVVGVGALGNELAKNLALAGVGRLVLCDPDVVTPSNLPRAVLFQPDDVGARKVDAAQRQLKQMAPDCSVEVRPSSLRTGVGLGELADADLVVSCLDTRQARLQLLGRCVLVDSVLVDGGTSPWGGEVRLRLDVDEPCYACPMAPFERSAETDPRSCGVPAVEPSSIVTTSLVAAWMTVGAVRVLFGRPPPWRFVRVDAPGGTTTPFTLERDDDCPFHQPLDGPVEPSPLTHEATVGELVGSLPPGATPLSWEPFTGSAGDGSIELATAPTSSRLAELGVAPGEIIPVRAPEGGYRWLRLTGRGTATSARAPGKARAPT